MIACFMVRDGGQEFLHVCGEIYGVQFGAGGSDIMYILYVNHA